MIKELEPAQKKSLIISSIALLGLLLIGIGLQPDFGLGQNNSETNNKTDERIKACQEINETINKSLYYNHDRKVCVDPSINSSKTNTS